MERTKEQWSSKFGFIMAAAGSAIGLGNLWKFPYVTGTNGGAVFLIVYIVFLILLGLPILLSELAIGRFAGLDAVNSCNKIGKNWGFVGGIGVVTAFLILGTYSVVGGWVIKYILSSFHIEKMTPEYYVEYLKTSFEPSIYTLIFIILTAVVVLGGVSKGIEKVSSILLPTLFVLFVGLMIYSLTLPNAIEGVKFFLVPNFDGITTFSDFASIAINAMGQVFFSLSLGMGTLITYGSYLPKTENLTKSTATIITLDTIIAIIAGLTILPAVFSIGLEPTSGSGLLFQTLPAVFAKIPAGKIVSFIFFSLILVAALTSSISLLQVIVAWFSNALKLSQKKATLIISGFIAVVSLFSSLSLGVFSDVKFFGMTFFDILSFLSDKIMLPLGGLFISILVGYVWGIKPAANEISNEGKLKFKMEKLYNISIKIIAPVLIVIIFISSII